MLLMLDQRLARLRARQQINSARSRLRNPKLGIRKAVLRSAVDLDRIPSGPADGGAIRLRAPRG